MFVIDIFKETVNLFLEMAPYLMIGLFFVGLLSIIFNKDLIIKYVGKDSIWSVIKASLFGIPLPLCSCGVIPSTVYLAKNGASKSAVVSFLISTPQTGIDSIIATYGMLGWVFAIFRPIAALMMGIIGGITTWFYDKRKKSLSFSDKIEKDRAEAFKNIKLDDDNCECNGDSCSIEKREAVEKGFLPKIKKLYKYSFVEFLDDISVQFMVGLIISGVISYVIPDDFFSKTPISGGILGMVVMLILGGPMYVCATASIPIAVTLMMKGFSPGMAYVFLVSGPATNIASLVILYKVLGKNITVLYLVIIGVLAVLFGLLLDQIFGIFNINELAMIGGMHHHNHDLGGTSLLDIIVGIVFFGLVLMSFYRKFILPRINKKEKVMQETGLAKVNIEGMNCNHCVMNVKKAISSVGGVEEVDVQLADNAAYVKGGFDMNELIKAVDAVGYKVLN